MQAIYVYVATNKLCILKLYSYVYTSCVGMYTVTYKIRFIYLNYIDFLPSYVRKYILQSIAIHTYVHSYIATHRYDYLLGANQILLSYYAMLQCS